MIKIEFDNVVKSLAGKVDSPRLEGRIIMGYVLKKDDNEIIPKTYTLTIEQHKQLESIIKQRSQGCPLDKIIGEKDFYKYRFKVSQDVLSPRPDTETLVEAAGKLIFKNNLKKVLDLGTGSGCILLSLLADFPSLFGVGVDISNKALTIAKENAQRLGVEQRCYFKELSWDDEKFADKLGEEFDMIVSNPPYIPREDIKGLDTGVKDYDPFGALDGGEDGYDHYRLIAKKVPQILSKEGYLLLECGINQAENVKNIFEKQGLNWQETLRDLGGVERCIILKK